MADDFANDDVKLVTYVIVSLRRGAERVLAGSANVTIITDNLTERDFMGWAIAQYLQSAAYLAMSPIQRLTLDDQKHLVVDYTVKQRWKRQPLKFEREQVDLLGAIRDAIADGE